MVESPRTGRLVSFTLRDLPPELLQAGKAVAVKREDDPLRALEIGLAAERPSATRYWIPAAAFERVVGKVRI
jgi:hypothetical protein